MKRFFDSWFSAQDPIRKAHNAPQTAGGEDLDQLHLPEPYPCPSFSPLGLNIRPFGPYPVPGPITHICDVLIRQP